MQNVHMQFMNLIIPLVQLLYGLDTTAAVYSRMELDCILREELTATVSVNYPGTKSWWAVCTKYITEDLRYLETRGHAQMMKLSDLLLSNEFLLFFSLSFCGDFDTDDDIYSFRLLFITYWATNFCFLVI